MTPFPLTHLGRRTLRIAGMSTLVVGIAACILMVAVDVVASHELYSSFDNRLMQQSSKSALYRQTLEPTPIDVDQEDEPIFIWLESPLGSALTGPPSLPLPRSITHVNGFANVTIAGIQFRLLGTTLSSGERLVLGESLSPINHAMTTLIFTEAILLPPLLLLVFGGSWLVGRRVADPVELTRQRHLAFSADASHELRTPLSVLQTELALLSEDARGEARSSCERMSGELARIRRIVEDLLWLARFDAEPAPSDNEPVDLIGIAGVVVERFQTLAAARSLQLTLSTPRNEAITITGAPEWLDRLAGVLVDNAIQYSLPPGEIIVSVADVGSGVRLSVRDCGPGIPPDERKRIFARFHRGTSDGHGSGLGLAIADSVVVATGGVWAITSHDSGGAEFAVTWRHRTRTPLPDEDAIDSE